MFVHVIRGPTRDAAALRRRLERWDAQLRRRAEGFLGRTAGVGAGGEAVIVARFRDVQAAAANRARAEQSELLEEVARAFAGPVTSRDATDVTEYLGGGSKDAGFVQVMTGSVIDRTRAEAIEAELIERLSVLRPELIGGYTAWHGDGTFTEVAYFTSEAAARAGEARALPDDVAAKVAEHEQCYGEISYLDITDPWLS